MMEGRLIRTEANCPSQPALRANDVLLIKGDSLAHIAS